MKTIVITLGILSVLFHPLTGSEAQLIVTGAWDFVIIQAGAWILLAFAISLVFLFGVEYAKYTMRQQKAVEKASKKVTKRKTDTALGNFMV